MLSTNISKTRRALTAPAIVIFIVIAVIIFHQRALVIKEITCQMGNATCPEGVLMSLDRIKSNSFLRFNQKDLRKQILSTGLVDRVEFSFKLPGKLIVTTETPSLSFLVKTAFNKISPSLNFLVSSSSAAPSIELADYVASMEGKTFQLLSTGTLSQSDADSGYFLIAETIPGKDYLIQTFAWLRSLATSSMKPEKIYFLSDMIILKQSGDPDLIMNFSADPAELVLSLQRLNQTITIKKPTVIDFRYSHPILK